MLESKEIKRREIIQPQKVSLTLVEFESNHSCWWNPLLALATSIVDYFFSTCIAAWAERQSDRELYSIHNTILDIK